MYNVYIYVYITIRMVVWIEEYTLKLHKILILICMRIFNEIKWFKSNLISQSARAHRIFGHSNQSFSTKINE